MPTMCVRTGGYSDSVECQLLGASLRECANVRSMMHISDIAFLAAAEGLTGTIRDEIVWLAVFDAGLDIRVRRIDEPA
jgi:hypothetical protein